MDVGRCVASYVAVEIEALREQTFLRDRRI